MVSNRIAATLTAMLALLLVRAPVGGQDLSRAITQYHHTTWTAKDGAPPEIWALDQGPDGFLWLGTGSGLYRFDGIAFERYQLARGEQLPSVDITAVKVLPSNEIWVGYSDGGVSRLKDGRVQTFKEADGIWPGMVTRLHQGKDGVLWAASHGGLARFSEGRWARVDADWNVPNDLIIGFFVARDGMMWLSTEHSIYFLRPGSRHFEPTGAITESATLTQTPDGRMWTADRPYGLRPLPNYAAGERREPWVLKPVAPGEILSPAGFAIDRQGVIWGTDRVNGGVFRIDPLHDSLPTHSLAASDVAVFRRADGLTAGRSIPILCDREGNVWVGTSAGLNRFRRSRILPDAAVPPSTAFGYSIAALGNETFVSDGLWLYRALPHEPASRFAKLPSGANTILFRGRDGALWYGNNGTMYQLRDHKLSGVALPKSARSTSVHAIAEDGTGTLWVAVERSGVYLLKNGAWSVAPGLDSLPTPVIAASDTAGAVWLGYTDNRISRHDAMGMRLFTRRDGLDVGNVELLAILGGVVWAGGELGVARLDDGRFRTVGPDRVPPLFGVSGIGRADDGALLFNGLMGLVRMDQDEVSRAFVDSSYVPTYELYDRSDGLPGVAQQGWHTPTVVPGGDGRLWFISNTGISYLAPNDREQNAVPPETAIVSAAAQGVRYATTGEIALPAGTRSLSIAYTAAALRAPESVRFRYRLEGLETEWTDAAGGREANYGNLGPGDYRFHVIAANEDGVWNAEGATLAVTIPPTFAQSWPFKVLLSLGLVTLVWFAYHQRMRHVADRIHSRMAERIEERERIARALHDTLLQSVQALTLRFQFALDELPAALPARGALEEAIDTADAVIAEGRDRIQDLRVLHGGTMEEMIAGIVRRRAFDPAVDVTVTSVGSSRPLDPLVLDEVSRIASEALFSIWRHARATRVKVHISHGAQFRLCITDNGIGIEADVLNRGGREGHFGLPGMRESARKLRGTLDVRPLPEGGVELQLVVPAAIAYRTHARRLAANRGRGG